MRIFIIAFLSLLASEACSQQKYNLNGRGVYIFTTPTPVPPVLPATLRERFGEGAPVYLGTRNWEHAVLESTIVKNGDSVYIYYTGSFDDTTHRLGLIKTNNIEATWPLGDSVIGMGLASPANRAASSSDIVKQGSNWYAFALDGYGFALDTRHTYRYTSSDGINWVDGGICLAIGNHAGQNIVNFGNTGILKNVDGTPAYVSGKYHMLVDGRVGSVWKSFRATADSLSGTWTIQDEVDGLQPYPDVTYGGTCLKYSGGLWHCFYHYSTDGPTLPTNVGYATSPDGQNWTNVELDVVLYSDGDPTPPANANAPYPFTDQAADIWVEEINGKVYIIAEFVDNSYTTGRIESQLWVWVFNGTFEQLVSDL